MFKGLWRVRPSCSVESLTGEPQPASGRADALGRVAWIVTVVLLSMVCWVRAGRAEDDEYYELMRVFVDTFEQIEQNYVKDVDRRELVEAAVRGMLNELDPYSNYISPEDLTHFNEEVEQEFGGVGIQVHFDRESRQLVVMTPLPGSPAYKAGVRAGDTIEVVEGKPVADFESGKELETAVSLLKGKPGEEVSIGVRHTGAQEVEDLKITREVIQLQTVLGDTYNSDGSWNYMLDPETKIGYIRLSHFSRRTSEELRDALRQLKKDGMKGLVIDLRFNPGGLLTSAVEVVDLFVDSGKIVSTEGRTRSGRPFFAKRFGTYDGFPMAILINRYSASASEIVSAALQDHERAIVVGERSWGKGSVQNVIELEEGKSALKLTTQSYHRPSGKNIHRFPDSKESDDWGVMPSDGYEVKFDGRQISQYYRYRQDRDVLDSDGPPETEFQDTQLTKALEYLREQLGEAPAKAAEGDPAPQAEESKEAASLMPILIPVPRAGIVMAPEGLLLAIESSCDETAAAVITRDRRVLSNVVASQHELHERFGGVVPEIASRAHVERILPVIDEALRKASASLDQLCAVAVATQPGLVGSLLVGLTAAKTLALVLDIPLVAVNHIEAHLYACQMSRDVEVFPAVGLVVSGGHTNLYDCRSAIDLELLGTTLDDAAGEAFDKVASLLDLGFPGGPAIERAAATGNPRTFDFPRTFLRDERLEFSFSGLKTAVLYEVQGQPGARKTPPEMTGQRRADLAASFQAAVIDVLVAKCRQALIRLGYARLCVGGGVAANATFRDRLEQMARETGTDLVIAPREYCTDNAAMGAVAWELLERGQTAPLDLDVVPGLVRGPAPRSRRREHRAGTSPVHSLHSRRTPGSRCWVRSVRGRHSTASRMVTTRLSFAQPDFFHTARCRGCRRPSTNGCVFWISRSGTSTMCSKSPSIVGSKSVLSPRRSARRSSTSSWPANASSPRRSDMPWPSRMRTSRD